MVEESNLINTESSQFANPKLNNSIHYQQRSIRSFTKLMIGGISLGLDELKHRMKIWEEKAQLNHMPTGLESPSKQNSLASNTDTVFPYEIIEGSVPQRDMGYALIGLIFDSQKRIISTSKKLGRIGKGIVRVTNPISRPLNRNWLLPPLRKRYEMLIQRGENEINRLTLEGRSEYNQSRKMAQIAFDDSFEEAVDSLATNPDVQELIQSQGMGLANEVIDEVRERTVSADNFLDGMVRHLLRMKPRSQIPAPKLKSRKDASPKHPI